MFRLKCFTIVCNANEYKMMAQGKSLGQLHDVHNEIKIGWANIFIYYIILKNEIKSSTLWFSACSKELYCYKVKKHCFQ